MPKGVEKNALAASGTAQGQANSAYGAAAPIYQQEAQNPQGYLPQEMANRITASNQTLGGANAAVAGEGALAAARTNNAGGYQAAIDDSARNASVTQSENNLGIMNQSDALKRQQQEQGLAGLENIYGQGNAAGQGYLKQANDAAANNPWLKILQSTIQASGQAAAGAGY